MIQKCDDFRFDDRMQTILIQGCDNTVRTSDPADAFAA